MKTNSDSNNINNKSLEYRVKSSAQLQPLTPTASPSSGQVSPHCSSHHTCVTQKNPSLLHGTEFLYPALSNNMRLYGVTSVPSRLMQKINPVLAGTRIDLLQKISIFKSRQYPFVYLLISFLILEGHIQWLFPVPEAM